jgi:hypothetical protein
MRSSMTWGGRLALMTAVAGGFLMAASPIQAQSGNQSDITGVNTTSAAGSTAPTPTPPPPAVAATVATVQQSVAAGTFTVDGTALSVTVQQGLADVLDGNTSSPLAQNLAVSLGVGGSAVIEALATFAQDPSGATFNELAAAWNATVEGADAASFQSQEFAAVFAVISELRTGFGDV